MLVSVGLVALAYLLGTFPTAQLVGAGRGVDPTSGGSGNPGATNVYRLAGRRAGAVVLLTDLIKGGMAAGAGLAVGGRLSGAVCGAAAVVGHCYPATRRFRGGKGVATAGGMVIVVYPPVAAAAAVVWLAVARLTRRASVASLATAGGIPLGAAALGRPGLEVGVLCGVALVVVVRHAPNIQRLLNGEEDALPERGT